MGTKKKRDAGGALSSPFMVMVAAILLAGAAVNAASQSLPSKSDQILFSCRSGNKEAYLIAHKSGADKSVGIQYVSISAKKPEFAFPSSPDVSGNIFKFSRRGYAGGGEYHITFKNNSFEYVIYDKNTSGDNQGLPIIKSGILVLSGGKVVSNRACTIEATGNISSAARAALKSEPFLQFKGIP